MQKNAQYWVQNLQLETHPEGGYFKETYRSKAKVGSEYLPPDMEGERNYSTSIYFLLESHHFSAFHRIAFDEIWHFYAGSPVTIYIFMPEGNLQTIVLGQDDAQGQVFQFVIPANCWFAAKVLAPDSYCLVGCTVSLGFDFRDFTLANKQDLITQYPHEKTLIESLTL